MGKMFFIVGLLLALQIGQGYCYAYDDTQGSTTSSGGGSSGW